MTKPTRALGDQKRVLLRLKMTFLEPERALSKRKGPFVVKCSIEAKNSKKGPFAYKVPGGVWMGPKDMLPPFGGLGRAIARLTLPPCVRLCIRSSNASHFSSFGQ